MSLNERLTPGFAPDEARLPEHARYRDEGRSVRFDECNRSGTMRAAAVLRHAQDLAWQHSETLEYGRAWYESRGVGWVVRSVDLLIDQPPRSNEAMTGTTALVGFRHVMARRRTRLFGSAGRVIADATIDWVMTDQNGRPVRFPAEFEPFVAEVGATFTPEKIPAEPTGDTPGVTVTVPLRVADFDPLGHVNNAAWLEIAEEALSAVAPAQLGAARRRIRLEYLGLTTGTAVRCTVRAATSEARVDIHDEGGTALVRALFDVVA
jgi:acyl-CoA thioesterase FadM